MESYSFEYLTLEIAIINLLF